MEAFFSNYWKTQETANVMINLADRADASMEQNTWKT